MSKSDQAFAVYFDVFLKYHKRFQQCSSPEKSASLLPEAVRFLRSSAATTSWRESALRKRHVTGISNFRTCLSPCLWMFLSGSHQVDFPWKWRWFNDEDSESRDPTWLIVFCFNSETLMGFGLGLSWVYFLQIKKQHLLILSASW